MATVTEPKTNEQLQPQVESQPSAEPELFAAEIAMEEKSANWMPLLLIAGLIIVVGGTIYYFIKGAKDVLTVPEANTAVSQILKAQAPPTVRFSTGELSGINERADPQYKLLEKAGVISTKPDKDALQVTLTNIGETLLSDIGGVQKTTSSTGAPSYAVPLAERKLVSIDKATMLKPHLAQVQYTWQWVPNGLGRDFDAEGSLVQSFSSWDRATLIKSYGVDFYGAPPTKASIVLMEVNDVWKPYTE